MRLISQQFMSLDGVTQGPGAPDEDTSDGFTRGGWFAPYVDDTFLRLVTGWTNEADGFLLGRRTYEAFARDWPQATDPGDEVARQLNGRPKYVASRTLRAGGWAPTTVLAGDVAAAVAELKRRPGRELQIHGSVRLAQSMLAAGLVDELRLVIAPVVVGAGRRMFPAGSTPAGLRLRRHESTPAGLAIHVYEPAGPPATGSYRTTDR
ncbi:dihydrofolate reductase family protein [Amorphoplanes nipponensis]|uniref:Deaminase reductase n=1 Tax=Actinoplanes nipponensis TaxID=135950 RepID=A0A919JE41_9ACTN|nr:dihydrofolate reductase family protein [Actinoplanes nipponensis]GIE47670.1 deaminase reductase [Actinoplanes nipponensis]